MMNSLSTLWNLIKVGFLLLLSIVYVLLESVYYYFFPRNIFVPGAGIIFDEPQTANPSEHLRRETTEEMQGIARALGVTLRPATSEMDKRSWDVLQKTLAPRADCPCSRQQERMKPPDPALLERFRG